MNGNIQSPIKDLEYGTLYGFNDWPVREIPDVAAGVYTVWQKSDLIYVGMSGRGATENIILSKSNQGSRCFGLKSRLNAHASGRRSGDQFCIYVCDRFILPCLTQEEIGQIRAGQLSLDKKTKAFVREQLTFRFITTANSKDAIEIEAKIRRGALSVGKPFLNPI